jgi:hypothetical protein
MPMERTGNEAAHFASGIRSAGQYIAQRPMIAAQARQRASQMVLNQSRGQQYQAQAALLAQKLQGLKTSEADQEALRAAAEAAAPYLQSGQMDHPAVHRFSGLVAKIAAQNHGHPAAEMLTSLGLPQPGQKYAADTRATAQAATDKSRGESAKTVADTRAAAELAKAGMNPFKGVVSGGAVMDTRNGQIVAHNPSANANKGEGAYETVEYDKVPGVDPVQGTPAIPAREGFFGIGKRAAQPAQPGIPGTPAVLKHTVKRPLNPAQTAKLPETVPADDVVNGDEGGETSNPAPIAQLLANTGVNVRTPAPLAPAPVAAPVQAAPTQVAPAQAPAAPQLADGTVIRHKQTGKQFIIKSGQPVPLEMAAAPTQDSGD